MTTRRTLARRSLAGLAVATLAIASFAGAASALPGPGQDGAPALGSLSIHKHAGTPTSQTLPNGQQQTVNRPVLAGVTFEVCQIPGIDLTTNAGWDAANAATPTGPGAVTCGANPATSIVTGVDGLAFFNNLPLGLYLVTETAAPVGVTKAAPFLVTIPYPSVTGSDTSWLYDVHVYPKNGLEGDGSKTVADPTTPGLGSTVPWTVTTRPIGSFNDGAPLTSYKIVDQLVAQLEYTGTTSLSYLTPGGTLTAVDAADFTLDPVAPNGTAGGTVTVTFTDLAWVNSLPAGTTFQWVLTTKVVGVGNLENKAFENIGGEDVEIGTATTQWGPVKLLKHQAGSTNGLRGAEFQIYAGTCPDAAAPLVGAPVQVNGSATFTSGADGVVNVAGLYVGKNGTPTQASYCVVETKAPAGYVLPTNPRTTVSVTPGTTAVSEIKIANVPVEGPDLPLTGAAGTLTMTVIGLTLVGAGISAIVVTRKRRRHETV